MQKRRIFLLQKKFKTENLGILTLVVMTMKMKQREYEIIVIGISYLACRSQHLNNIPRLKQTKNKVRSYHQGSRGLPPNVGFIHFSSIFTHVLNSLEFCSHSVGS